MERTYIMLKPDTYRRKIMGEIITRIEKKGFAITDMRMMHLDEDILKEHYAHVADRPFFPEIVMFMTSGPVIGMIVEGEGVIEGMRSLMGSTKWYDAIPGTIRGDFASNSIENLLHGSDSALNAELEIKRFFRL